MEDESDDGISVISESELHKNSDNEEKLVDLPKFILNEDLRKNVLMKTLHDDGEVTFEPLTPPDTPVVELCEFKKNN